DDLAESLVAQGFFTFDELSVIEPDQLAELGGLTPEQCDEIIAYADEMALKAEEQDRLDRERRRAAADIAAGAPAADMDTDEEAEADLEADADSEKPDRSPSAEQA